jgi:Rhodopirellula transposase DDE domain
LIPRRRNWRGQPLTSLKAVVNLIAGTAPKKGLNVHAGTDGRSYPAGVKVPDSEMAEINLQRDAFHGEWNYEILPRTDTVIS